MSMVQEEVESLRR